VPMASSSPFVPPSPVPLKAVEVGPALGRGGSMNAWADSHVQTKSTASFIVRSGKMRERLRSERK